MFEWVFDLPLAITGPGFVVGLSLFGVIGLRLVRRYVLPRLRITPEDSDFGGSMLQAVMTVYGLALALIAVSVWQNYMNISQTLSQEATSLGALYRDISAYPEPVRTQLQDKLREYVTYIIHDVWPLQRRGQFPTGGVERMNRFQKLLLAFEPATEGQKLLHGETLRQYNQMIQFRRQRLDAVLSGLPGVLWLVVILGALLGIMASFFVKINDERYQQILVVLLASLVGMVIFIVSALDRPFRGDLGLQPNSLQLIYDQLMKPGPAPNLQ